jgi:hypothetical protein
VDTLRLDVWELNKDNIGEGEKELWMQIEVVLNDVLDELTGKDKIRIFLTENEKPIFGFSWRIFS